MLTPYQGSMVTAISMQTEQGQYSQFFLLLITFLAVIQIDKMENASNENQKSNEQHKKIWCTETYFMELN